VNLEESLLLNILINRRHSWTGHIIRHNEFAANILEGAICGKQAVGRPRLQYYTATYLLQIIILIQFSNFGTAVIALSDLLTFLQLTTALTATSLQLMCCGLDKTEFVIRFPSEARNSLLFLIVQRDSGTCTISSSNSREIPFSRNKAVGSKA
jgi:hypothetical protein